MKKEEKYSAKRGVTRIILSLFLVSILLLTFFSISAFAFSDSDKKEVLTTLYDFHKAAQDEDLEKYFSVQEMEYYEQLYEYPETYESYIQSTFDAFDTLDFSIDDPSVMFDNNSAFVFYRLKATVVLTETGEKKKIENDMVALLFKYPEGWKLRWSILHTLFEQKLLNEVVFDTAIDDAVSQTENTTLKQIFTEQGIYEAPEDEVLTPATHHSLLPWILLAFIFIALAIYFLDAQRRKKCVAAIKPATKKNVEKMKHLAKKGASSAKHATLKGAEKMKPLAKNGMDKMKTTVKKAKQRLQEKNSTKEQKE